MIAHAIFPIARQKKDPPKRAQVWEEVPHEERNDFIRVGAAR